MRRLRCTTTITVFTTAVFVLPGRGAEITIPDFSGLWGRDSLNLESPDSGPGPVVNMAHTRDGTQDMSRLVGDYTNPILKPESAAILKQRGHMSLEGISVPNPHDQCQPEPPPLLFAVQFAFEMLQEKEKITLLYSHDNKVRHVPLNSAHPAGLKLSGQGDSIAHYDGDTLVIDTVGIKSSPISAVDWYGTPHTDQLHVVERYRLVDEAAAKAAAAKHDTQYRRAPRPNPNGVLLDKNYRGPGLQLELTVEDPGAFTMPWKAFVTYQRAEGELWEMRCAENIREYYAGIDTPIPQTAKPDF